MPRTIRRLPIHAAFKIIPTECDRMSASRYRASLLMAHRHHLGNGCPVHGSTNGPFSRLRIVACRNPDGRERLAARHPAAARLRIMNFHCVTCVYGKRCIDAHGHITDKLRGKPPITSCRERLVTKFPHRYLVPAWGDRSRPAWPSARRNHRCRSNGGIGHGQGQPLPLCQSCLGTDVRLQRPARHGPFGLRALS